MTTTHLERTGGEELTHRERLCLEFLNSTLGTSAFAAGRYVYDCDPNGGGSNIPAIGAALLGRLRKKGLAWVGHDGLWNISTTAKRILTPESSP